MSYSGDANLYGWGDWFIGHVVSSFVAWPVVFATDMLWGNALLPTTEKQLPGFQEHVALLSLVPKVAASFVGAHLYLPGAWWVWKLTLLPALPVGAVVNLVAHVLTNDGRHKEAIYDDWLPMKPADPAAVVKCTAWLPSTSEEKSVALHLKEAAPLAVQLTLARLALKRD